VKKYRPDGYMVTHTASNFQASFGPFSLAEAEWFVKFEGFGAIVPLFKTIDWDRDSELLRGRAELDTE